MDKFMSFELYHVFAGKNPITRFLCKLRKLFYFDKTIIFATGADIKFHRACLNYSNASSKHIKPLRHYIRVGKVDLSDCNWDIDLFNEIRFICHRIDKLIITRKLVRFNHHGIVYNDDTIFSDQDYYYWLRDFQQERTNQESI